ncbi:hypothetical protein STEG23_001492, partial [Scotinomys teguina]
HKDMLSIPSFYHAHVTLHCHESVHQQHYKERILRMFSPFEVSKREGRKTLKSIQSFLCKTYEITKTSSPPHTSSHPPPPSSTPHMGVSSTLGGLDRFEHPQHRFGSILSVNLLTVTRGKPTLATGGEVDMKENLSVTKILKLRIMQTKLISSPSCLGCCILMIKLDFLTSM